MAWEALAIRGAILAGAYIYFRATREEPPKPKPARTVSIPRVDPGAPYPRVYGRCRINAPIVAWCGSAEARDSEGEGMSIISGGQPFIYGLKGLLFVIGIPFRDGVNRAHKLYAGDLLLTNDLTQIEDMTGAGEGEWEDVFPGVTSTYSENEHAVTGGRVEFLDGRSTQRLVDGDAAVTMAGMIMTGDGVLASQIPGYRGLMLLMLANGTNPANVGSRPWFIGSTANLPGYAIEGSSYPSEARQLIEGNSIGVDANPADVLYDLLTALYGKLGLSTTLIDLPSFEAAATQLLAEGDGYSRCFEDDQEAEEDIEEILRQIDAVLYEDPATGKLKIKLVRPDYPVGDILTLTPDNCTEIVEYEISGLSTPVTSVRVVFRNRQKQYRDDSAQAHAMGAAVSANQQNEVVISMPGITTLANAQAHASRELSFLTRPIARCRAKVDRTFVLTNPGDVIAMTWPEYGIDGKLFRVADVDRGTLNSSAIELTLLEDAAYQYRGEIVSDELPSFPDAVVGD